MPRPCLLPLTTLATAALLGCTPASTGQQAKVVSVGDGDTLRVQQGSQRRTIRLACIDAPEMAQAPYGAKARDYLRMRLPIGRPVTLKVQTTDRYDRTVAEVFSDININLALVEDGQAFVYRKYLRQCDAREYLAAEDRARRSRRGVWQIPGGITRPWDFRRGPGSGGRSARSTAPPPARRYRCNSIGSSSRAQELLRQGHTHLDGDGDGEACERLRH